MCQYTILAVAQLDTWYLIVLRMDCYAMVGFCEFLGNKMRKSDENEAMNKCIGGISCDFDSFCFVFKER